MSQRPVSAARAAAAAKRQGGTPTGIPGRPAQVDVKADTSKQRPASSLGRPAGAKPAPATAPPAEVSLAAAPAVKGTSATAPNGDAVTAFAAAHPKPTSTQLGKMGAQLDCTADPCCLRAPRTC